MLGFTKAWPSVFYLLLMEEAISSAEREIYVYGGEKHEIKGGLDQVSGVCSFLKGAMCSLLVDWCVLLHY